MKKCITLFVATVITFASFANFSTAMAPWDRPLTVTKIVKSGPVNPADKVLVDPYITNIGFYNLPVNGPIYTSFEIQIYFNISVPVPYYVVCEVWGNWVGSIGYATPQYFTILFSTGQWKKIVDYPLSPVEEIYPGISYYSDYGPQ